LEMSCASWGIWGSLGPPRKKFQGPRKRKKRRKIAIAKRVKPSGIEGGVEGGANSNKSPATYGISTGPREGRKRGGENSKDLEADSPALGKKIRGGATKRLGYHTTPWTCFLTPPLNQKKKWSSRTAVPTHELSNAGRGEWSKDRGERVQEKACKTCEERKVFIGALGRLPGHGGKDVGLDLTFGSE